MSCREEWAKERFVSKEAGEIVSVLNSCSRNQALASMARLAWVFLFAAAMLAAPTVSARHGAGGCRPAKSSVLHFCWTSSACSPPFLTGSSTIHYIWKRPH